MHLALPILGAAVLAFAAIHTNSWQPTQVQTPTQPQPQKSEEASLRVLRTREVRQFEAPGVRIDSPLVFSDPAPKSGNWLTFDLAFDGIPDSSCMVGVELLSASATDDLGTDLIAPIIKHAGNDPKKWHERSLLLHDSAPTFRWFVTAPSRTATSITATLVVRARIAARRDTLVVKPTREWKKFDHPSTQPLNGEFRFRRESELSVYLDTRPRGVEDFIFSISSRPPQFRARAHFSEADRNGVAFLLAKDAAEGADVRVQILADTKSVEATLVLKNHPLP